MDCKLTAEYVLNVATSAEKARKNEDRECFDLKAEELWGYMVATERSAARSFLARFGLHSH